MINYYSPNPFRQYGIFQKGFKSQLFEWIIQFIYFMENLLSRNSRVQNILNNLASQRIMRILFVGCERSGYSDLMETMNLLNTQFENDRELAKLKHLTFVIAKENHKFQPDSYQAIICVVDFSKSRSRHNYQQLLSKFKCLKKSTPILFLANKAENQNSLVELYQELNLDEFKNELTFRLQRCSQDDEDGLADGLEWLADKLR